MKRRFQKMSLRLRLTLVFLGVAVIVWLAAGLLSWRECSEELSEFFDTYQLLLAGQLVAADWRDPQRAEEISLKGQLKRIEAQGGDEGEVEDEALGFAVFNQAGELLFSDGRRGRRFLFDPGARGFVNQFVSGEEEKWRLVWLKSQDGQYTVAVGQELKFREKASLEMTGQTLWPWLAGFVFLTAASAWLVGRELRPLKNMTGELSGRKPADFTPVSIDHLPPEVAPLGQALNGLFQRLESLLARERGFISDAAHELRTPLAALRVQAEVAQMSADDPRAREEALKNLTLGIDRTARLVEQLLTLSRLDSGSGFQEAGPVDWPALIQDVVAESQSGAGGKTEVVFRRLDEPALRTGRPLLLGIMLRNLLDNARRYSPDGAAIEITLDADRLEIRNSGGRVAEEYLGRLGERFFRPPGQEQGGSGLGLSIVRKVAEIHACRVTFQNLSPDGFAVVVHLPAQGG